jgi:hypothetical protein
MIKITKEDYLQLSFNYENVIDIVGFHYIISTLYLCVHSPKTCIANGDYLWPPFNCDYCKTVFTKTTFKALEWPYSTDCYHYNYKEYVFLETRIKISFIELFTQIKIHNI